MGPTALGVDQILCSGHYLCYKRHVSAICCNNPYWFIPKSNRTSSFMVNEASRECLVLPDQQYEYMLSKQVSPIMASTRHFRLRCRTNKQTEPM